MKWVNVNNSISGDHYELWNKELKLLDLHISSRTRIARVESATDKRLFFVEKRGFLHAKTVIRNEYGIKLGELFTESNESFIQLDGFRYVYRFPQSANDPLIIYNESRTIPVLSCDLSQVFQKIPGILERPASFHDSSYPALLMALCWNLQKTTVGDRLKETAA